MAVTKRKRNSVRNPTGKNGYVLPQEKLEQREKAFAIYRDMGPARSLGKLVAELKQKHPEIAASRPAVENWSAKHDWNERCKAHDGAMMAGRAQILQQSPALSLDPSFDQIGALLQAANQALTRAMNASPVVTRPSDVKALVDAASNALKLVETIKNQSTGKVSREDIAQEMARVLDEVRKAREMDVELMVEAELKRRGIDVSGGVAPGKSAVDGASVDAIEVDAGSEEAGEAADGMSVGEPAAGAVQDRPDSDAKPGLRLFADVLKAIQGGS